MEKPRCCSTHITVQELPEGWGVDGVLVGGKEQAIAAAVKQRSNLKVLAGEVKPFIYIELSKELHAKMPAEVWA